MKKLIFLLFVLVGCESNSPANRLQNNDKIQQQLPEGCTIKYLGDYYKGSYPDIPVVMVDCERTTTINTNQWIGKNTYQSTVVKIKQLKTEIEEKTKEKEELESKLTKPESCAATLQ
jgi:hypothetical protein